MEFIFDALQIETLNALANLTIEEKLNFHTSLVDRLANEQSGVGSIILQTMIYVTEHEYLLRAAQEDAGSILANSIVDPIKEYEKHKRIT